MIDPLVAIRLSLEVALLATFLAAPPAIFVGYALSRASAAPRVALTALTLAPLVLPPVVTGLLLLRFFGRHGPLAALGVTLPFTFFGAVVAALVVGFPLFALAARNAFESVDRRYEELSATLGVSRSATFLRVTLPLATRGLAAGAVLMFARSLGEFGATAVLAGNMEGETRTIALAVYTLMESPGAASAQSTLVWASLGLSVVAIVVHEALMSAHARRVTRGAR